MCKHRQRLFKRAVLLINKAPSSSTSVCIVDGSDTTTRNTQRGRSLTRFSTYKPHMCFKVSKFRFSEELESEPGAVCRERGATVHTEALQVLALGYISASATVLAKHGTNHNVSQTGGIRAAGRRLTNKPVGERIKSTKDKLVRAENLVHVYTSLSASWQLTTTAG